ncbi:MAG TPA: hypothetical protein VNR65_05130, partial [Geobacterales bacterium]|nr:hypothetical protein [Geobacterales bacterium]
EAGEMTILKTSKPRIGGAIPKRDQADLEVDNLSVDRVHKPRKMRARNREICGFCAAGWRFNRQQLISSVPDSMGSGHKSFALTLAPEADGHIRVDVRRSGRYPRLVQ